MTNFFPAGLGAAPLYKPVISQAIIAGFIHKACSDGLGKGFARRIYTPEEIAMFLEAFSNIVN
jgi:hypothetical protein